MIDIELFSPDFKGDHFENYSRDNDFTYWYASELMKLLGYVNMNTFQRAINKAMTTCNTLNIPIMDNFIQEQKNVDNRPILDFRLSRFACYLIVMNADNRKPAVAKAQAYFASLAGAVHNYMLEVNKVERLVIRDEISERERSLSGVVKEAGIINYAFFQNAGYRGMYNKSIAQLRELRNIPIKRSPVDFMGKEELAANLFRITQTELKIKQEQISEQPRLEAAAEVVGKKVRKTMIEISGVAPEDLPPHEDLVEVKKQLKTKSKEIKKIDKKKD